MHSISKIWEYSRDQFLLPTFRWVGSIALLATASRSVARENYFSSNSTVNTLCSLATVTGFSYLLFRSYRPVAREREEALAKQLKEKNLEIIKIQAETTRKKEKKKKKIASMQEMSAELKALSLLGQDQTRERANSFQQLSTELKTLGISLETSNQEIREKNILITDLQVDNARKEKTVSELKRSVDLKEKENKELSQRLDEQKRISIVAQTILTRFLPKDAF